VKLVIFFSGSVVGAHAQLMSLTWMEVPLPQELQTNELTEQMRGTGLLHEPASNRRADNEFDKVDELPGLTA
jgi:hypothetical protein